MSEVWQFVAVVIAGVAIIVLWILFIYLPRRTWEGGSRRNSAVTRVDRSERDDLP